MDSREVPQKLVYVTVEYTNIGTEELNEVLFLGNLMKIVEEDGQMKMYRGKASDGSAYEFGEESLDIGYVDIRSIK